MKKKEGIIAQCYQLQPDEVSGKLCVKTRGEQLSYQDFAAELLKNPLVYPIRYLSSYIWIKCEAKILPTQLTACHDWYSIHFWKEFSQEIQRMNVRAFENQNSLQYAFAQLIGRYFCATAMIINYQRILLVEEEMEAHQGVQLSLFFQKEPLHLLLPLPFLHSKSKTDIQLSFARYLLEQQFTILVQRWQLERQQSLAKDLRHYQQQLKEVSDFQERLARQSIGLQLQDTFAAPYTFYKASTAWHIRFDGKLIDLNGNPDKGLSYIHRLLQHPDRYFYVNDLELSFPQKESIQFNESFKVEIDSIFSRQIPESEAELKKLLSDILEEEPDEFEAEEKRIYYLAEVMYVLNLLIQKTYKNKYFAAYDFYKKESEKRIKKFQRSTSDRAFVDTVIRKSKVIRKAATDHYKEKEKMRGRVTRAIRNAIASMNSEELKKHFDEYLEIGIKSKYKNNSVHWELFSDRE
ncbi:MAG: hypothetical protein AAF849_04835 [Bacteroidota bacterium]